MGVFKKDSRCVRILEKGGKLVTNWKVNWAKILLNQQNVENNRKVIVKLYRFFRENQMMITILKIFVDAIAKK